MTGADLLALIKKQPIAFACGLIIVACGAALFFPREAVTNAQALYEEKEKEFQKIDANVRNSAGLAEAAAEMQEAGRQFEARLVRAPQLANNLQFFYRLENETGVKLIDVRQQPIPAPKQGVPRGAYAPVPFAVSVQGDYAQVHDFLRRVEAGPHFLRFSQVSLSKLAAAGDARSATSNAMSATINLELLGTP